MSRQYVQPHTARQIGWLRASAVIAGGAFMLLALISLYSTAWDHNRGAVLSMDVVRLLLPFVLGGFVFWAASLMILAAGCWPPRGGSLTISASIGALAIAWVLAWVTVSAFSGPHEQSGNLEFFSAMFILIIAYVAIAAAAREGWLMLAIPVATVVVTYIISSWTQLATNNSEYGGVEIDLSSMGNFMFTWFIMLPASLALTGLGLLIGNIFLDE